MNALLLFGLLTLNTTVSMWNAYVAGRIWRECAGWMKAVAWSALVMSVCGFTSVLTTCFGFVMVATNHLTAHGFKVLEELTYLMIIFPVVGAGLIITIHSWIEAYKRRDFWSVGGAMYNTFAQVSNTWGAIHDTAPAFSDVFSFFKSDDKDDNAQSALIALIVAVALALSVGMTYLLWTAGLKHSVSALAAQRVG